MPYGSRGRTLLSSRSSGTGRRTRASFTRRRTWRRSSPPLSSSSARTTSGRSRCRSGRPSGAGHRDPAAGYGFPGEVVDGNDFFAVREAAERAVARARAGDGPTLIEAKTYRVTPHSAATPTDDRPPEELELWRSRDPILRFADALAERQLVAPARIAEIEAEAIREVEEAADFALGSPFPDTDAALTDVYAPSDWNADGRLR